MSMTHLEIAGKLTDRAIEMLFAGDDYLYVITMAHPGHMLFHDVCRAQFGDENPSAQMAERFKGRGLVTPEGKVVQGVADVFRVLRRDANSLKHGSLAPSIDLSSVCATIATSCNDSQAMGALSWPQRAFMFWFYRCQEPGTEAPWAEAEAKLPSLWGKPVTDQLAEGRELLARGP